MAGYVAQARPDLTLLRSEPPCTNAAISLSSAIAPSTASARVLRRGTPGFPACGSGRAKRITPLRPMVGRGAAAPPAKKTVTVVPSGRGGAAPPTDAATGRGAPAGDGAVPGFPGRGAGNLGTHRLGQVPPLPLPGRGGPRPPAPGVVAAPTAASRGGSRPPVPGVTTGVQPAAGRGGTRPSAPGAAVPGRGGAVSGAAPTVGYQPRAKPPPHYVARPAQDRSGSLQTRQNTNTTESYDPPRGQWGDDGSDAYGVGQHRGSSSTGGGRGYAWQSDGSAERPFLGPAGGFVEGASGPDHRQRGGFRGHRGGRGGGRGRFRRPPPPRAVDPAASTAEDGHTLTEPQPMEVNVGVSVEVPEAGTVEEATERASKYARKKERMLCYRCGEKGHFIAECVAQLCETCGKPVHDSGSARCCVTCLRR